VKADGLRYGPHGDTYAVARVDDSLRACARECPDPDTLGAMSAPWPERQYHGTFLVAYNNTVTVHTDAQGRYIAVFEELAEAEAAALLAALRIMRR